MKKSIVGLGLYACCLACYSQTSATKQEQVINRNMAFEVSAGYSMPIGKYASSDRQNIKSGYTSGGWHTQITFDWMGKKDFGMALQYTFQRNPMENSINNVYPHGDESLRSGLCSNHYLMLGPVFMKKIKRLHLDAKILGGVILSSNSNFTTLNPRDTSGKTKDLHMATGFAYQISAGVGYVISSHITFKLNLNLLGGWLEKNIQYGSQYLYSKQSIDPKTGFPFTESIYSPLVDYEIKKVVTTLNPSIGIVYKF